MFNLREAEDGLGRGLMIYDGKVHTIGLHWWRVHHFLTVPDGRCATATVLLSMN